MSKSSPYAVSTDRRVTSSTALDEVKKYLYIKTDIETNFKRALTSLSATDKKIIFLCGSSGDGKSEILTKYNKEFATRANFHLDATHSFRPSDSAIQTLDELFTNFEHWTKVWVLPFLPFLYFILAITLTTFTYNIINFPVVLYEIITFRCASHPDTTFRIIDFFMADSIEKICLSSLSLTKK